MARAAAQERSSAIRSSRAVSGGAPCIAWFSETDWLRETELTVDTLREGVAGLSMGGYGAPETTIPSCSSAGHRRRSFPYLCFLIGTGDQFPTFLPRNRALTDFLRAYGARYEYHEVPGGHDWQVWGGALPSLLARF